MKQRLVLGFCVAFLLFAASGCDTAEQQKEFEDDAFSAPSGYTHTDEDGQILGNDEDDWRTAPAYSTRVLIDPAFPNPATAGDFVTIPVQVREFDSILGGLEVISYDENGIPRRLDEIRDASDPGAYIFTFSPSLLGVRGLTRIFIVDSRGELVSYGDLFIDQ